MDEDKRRFGRYEHESDLLITVGGKTFNARTINYSFDGLSATLEKIPELKCGDMIELDMKHIKLKCNGKIVWIYPMNGFLKIGIQRMGLLYGNFSDFHLPDILLGLQRSNKTGVFHIISGAIHKKVSFDGGDMVFASSNQPEERFGFMLIKKGIITNEQYKQAAVTMKAEKVRLGKVLVQQGHISAGLMASEVHNHAEMIILSLFDIHEGEFMFKDDMEPPKESIKLKLSASSLIYRGIKNSQNIQKIKTFMPGPNAVLTLSADPLALFQDMKLDAGDKGILSIIDGKKTLDQIIVSSSLSREDCIKVIYALLSTRIVEVCDSVVDAQVNVSVEDIVDAHVSDGTNELVRKVENLYVNYKKLGYYGILGLAETASRSEIKKAYYKSAKEYHPDKHYQLPEEMKDKLNAVFTYITSAYQTLMSKELKMNYDSRTSKAPEHEKVDAVKLAADKFSAGKQEYWRGNYSASLKYFSEAAYLKSDAHKYHYYMGLAFFRLGKQKDAERSMMRALRGDPFNADYLAETGFVFLKLGFSLRARGNFERALKIKPGHKRATEGLAEVD